MLADLTDISTPPCPCHSHVREGASGEGGGADTARRAKRGSRWLPALPRCYPRRAAGELYTAVLYIVLYTALELTS